MIWQQTVRTRICIRDLYRGINDLKRAYRPRCNLVKDENGDLLADSHNILNRWKNYFSQLLSVPKVSDVRQKYIQLNCWYLILVLLRLKLLFKS
jgi:hypothetical protein